MTQPGSVVHSQKVRDLAGKIVAATAQVPPDRSRARQAQAAVLL